MKKSLYTITIATTFLAASLLGSCQSAEDKEKAALDKVENAQKDLDAAKLVADSAAQKVAQQEEWVAFKTNAEATIADNNVRIVELRAQKKKPGKTFDKAFEERITQLEKQNGELQAKIDKYEKENSNWESFKTEFNHDMNEVAEALRDLTVDNKK